MEKSNDIVTIFQDALVPEFVVRLKEGEPKERLSDPIRESHFYMMLSSKSDKLTKFWLQLIDGRIYMKNSPDGQRLAYIDIAYARLKLLKSTTIVGKTVNGIRFIKNKNYEEIYHQDLEVVLDWYDLLKKYCVLSKFREIYKIQNLIGKGNFAKVYVTKKLESQKDYAVKIFDKKLIVQDKFERQCLLYELKMMREVSHSNLLEILEIYEGDNNIYCLGKLYAGESLSALITDKKKEIPKEAIYLMAGRMLQALAYLEDKHIIHRDMKPENIVYSQKGSFDMPVLIDLGFATFEKDFRLLFTRCGTPGYVAPEVLNDKDYTCKADLFSLGIILYMMVTRVNPFENESYEQLIKNNLKGDVDFVRLLKGKTPVNDDMIALIKQMLIVNPKSRPTASALLATLLETFSMD